MTRPVPASRPEADDLVVCDAARTGSLLDFGPLLDELAHAAREHENHRILSPERTALPLGRGGTLLSMPAAAADIAIHKLVTVQPANAALRLPTIHGVVTVCDAITGKPLCLLDGPEVTGRRTAAVSLLAIRALLGREPKEVLLIGTGTQARHHLRALQAIHPACRIRVRGRHASGSATFCETAASDLVRPCGVDTPDGVDVVIALTTSTVPVYDEAARPGRLVIGVGAFRPEMAEFGSTPLHGSTIYADDPAGARHEAGDLLRAGIDWQRVRSLAVALREPRDVARAAVFKSVGTAAWDLAAARVALRALAPIAPLV